MADSLENESARALLTMKNGRFADRNDAASIMTSLKVEPKMEVHDSMSPGNVGFLTALGLHPAGQESPLKRTPVKDSPSNLNRRGTPQRLRKRNRLYFDDNHVSGDTYRSSPKKPFVRDRLSPSLPAQTPVPLVPVSYPPSRSLSTPPPRTSHPVPATTAAVRPAQPPTIAATTTSSASTTALSAAGSEEQLVALTAAAAASPSRPESPILTLARQRQAHDLGLRLRNLLKLPKAHKFVCYEWFYSTLDECLLSGCNDFMVCLREHYPRLKTTCLARKQWCKLRRQMGKPRRCSPAFFLEERSVLQAMRQKVRSLQSLQRKAFERSFLKSLPEEIPLQLSIGTRITARLRQPQDGLFSGTVEAVDTQNASYRVRFDKPGLEPQTVSDCEVRASLPVDTVPTISFVRGASTRTLVFNTPPRTPHPLGLAIGVGGKGVGSAVSGGVCSSALHMGSPLSNDPLLSAITPTKSGLQMLDEDSMVNGYSIRFLLHVVQLNKVLIMKREQVSQLDALNSQAEQSQLYVESLGDEFQRRYARLVLRLEKLNQHLHDKITSVQMFCQKMLPEIGLVPDVFPTHMKSLCDEEAGRQVAAAASASAQLSQPPPADPAAVQLVTRLVSILLQMKNFADNEMNPFELHSLEETMREISGSLQRPENAAVFQDQVQVNVHHVQNLLTARWNSRSHAARRAAAASTSANPHPSSSGVVARRF